MNGAKEVDGGKQRVVDLKTVLERGHHKCSRMQGQHDDYRFPSTKLLVAALMEFQRCRGIACRRGCNAECGCHLFSPEHACHNLHAHPGRQATYKQVRIDRPTIKDPRSGKRQTRRDIENQWSNDVCYVISQCVVK
jgi:hypothetical protein